MAAIQRNLFNKINGLLKNFPVVAILGARQAGKTTLARQLRSNWQYFDLENLNDLDRITHDTEFFFKQNPEHLIIDETQEYPNLFKMLRGVIDQKREQKNRFLLTGSSSPELLKQISESLAGRIAITQLDPLKMNEIYQQPLSNFYKIFKQPLDQVNKKKLIINKTLFTQQQINHAWFYGGYPEPLLKKSEKFFHQWMEQYRHTYINRDISLLFPNLNKHNYQRFLTMLGHLSGTILNKNDLARALEISEKTVRNYLEIVEGTYLWQSIKSFEYNKIKSIIKMPKGYLRDTGLLHHLILITKQQQLFQHPIVGKSFEAFVINELLKGLHATNITNWQPNYYRTKSNAEVDFILEGPFGTLPIEIKYGSRTQMSALKYLKQFVIENKLPFGMILNRSEKITWLTEQIVEVPVGLL